MKVAGAPNQRRAGGGFTLIELLLTLVLLLLLLGAVVVNFTGLQTGVQLDEGAEQFESLIRYARAHAANTGCRVQLSFEETIDEDMAVPLGNVFATWEPDPLERPGVFVPLADVAHLTENLLALVEVDDVVPLGAAAHDLEEATVLSFAPIMFYPDGSSDSAEIVLVGRDLEDDRRLALQIIGTTGIVRRKQLLPDVPEDNVALPGGQNAN